MITFLVLLGGALGAAGRYLTDLAVSRWLPGDLPAGTTAVNLTGSLALGLAAGTLTRDGTAYALLATGICGAFTTWSTLALQAAELLARRPRVAAAYLALNLLGGIALAAAGLAATGALPLAG